nr:hypothetical protein [Tanacetum cinerariifolium]
MALPSTPNVFPPLSPIITLGISPSKLLLTLKSTPSPLTSPPPAPTQPSKHSSSLTINLDPVELIFSTHPSSPHAFFESLIDLPPKTRNPPPPRPSFKSIERLANQPLPLSVMEPPILPFLAQLLPLGPNNPCAPKAKGAYTIQSNTLIFVAFHDLFLSKKELLKKIIYEGPYIMTEITHSDTPDDGDNPRIPGRTKKETYQNTTLDRKALIYVKAEAVHMILNGIGVQSAKRVKDYDYHKEKRLICNKEATCIQLSAKHSEWLQDIYDKLDKQELQAHYMYMEKILETQPESISDTYVVENIDSYVIPGSSDMNTNEREVDQHAKEPEDELAYFFWNNDKVLKAKNDSLIAELNQKTLEITNLKARLQDKTIVNADMRALLNNMKEKSVDTKFEKPSVVRQPIAFKFQQPLVMGKQSPFSISLERHFFPKSMFAPKTTEKNDLSKPVT